MTQTIPKSRGPSSCGMPAERVQAARFGTARGIRASALLEDYSELISDLLATYGEARPTDIARRLGVSHATTIRALARLKREALVMGQPYRGIFLTEAGQAMAEKARSRHRLVVDLLVAIGVPREAAETDAEGMEHYVSDTTMTAMKRFLVDRRTPGKWS